MLNLVTEVKFRNMKTVFQKNYNESLKKNFQVGAEKVNTEVTEFYRKVPKLEKGINIMARIINNC